MRKLMLFTIGFATGCAAGAWFFPTFWMLVAAGLFAALFLLLVFIHPNHIRRIVAAILFGVSMGLCWMFCYDFFYVNTAREIDGKSEKVQIELIDFVSSSAYGVSGTGKLYLDGKSYKVCFYLNEKLAVYPGDVLSGTFNLRFTGYNGDDSPTYHQGKGIFLLAYADDSVAYYHRDKLPAKYFAAYFRRYITDKLKQIFPQDQAGFAMSLLLGDTSLLSSEYDTALKTSGIRHIVAVSGLHVSILMSFAYSFSFKNRYLQAAIGLPILFLFAAIAGFTPSVVRACVMQAVLLIAILIDDEFDTPTALAFAVLLIIAINPLTITSVSFQLSVGCVIGINLFNKKIHDVLMRTGLGPAKGRSVGAKLIRWFVSTVSITLSTMAVTLPISAYYFGTVSIVSVISNLLTLWLVSICFYGVLIGCIAGFAVPMLGSLIASLISWPMRLVLAIARLLSQIPFASVSIHNPYFLGWVIFCYVLLAAFLLIRKKRPLLFAGLAIGGLCLCIVFAYVEPRMDQYRMTVLDVGQGQCILLQSKRHCYVVDCGGDSPSGAADLAAQTLRSNGIQKIDGLILTHFDNDHSAGAEAFLSQIESSCIYIPDAVKDRSTLRGLQHYAQVEVIKTNTVLDCGVGSVSIFPGQEGATDNESSLCILFQADDCDILITADRNTAGERYLLDHADIPQIDVLVVGHHGAASSTSLYLLQQIKPAVAVISVGAKNRYGHPDEAVLDRLEYIQCVVWRTDQDGTIIIRG